MAEDNYTSVTMPQQAFTYAVVSSGGIKYFDATYPDDVYDMYGFKSIQAWSPGVYRSSTITAFVFNAFTTGFK